MTLLLAIILMLAQDRDHRAGQKVFERECAACHGRSAEGTKSAPRLRRPEIRNAPTDALLSILRNGILRRGMPSFSHLPPQQRRQIVDYLKSLD